MANETGPIERNLAPLGELGDYKVAEGNPDIRGWEVCGADGTRIGDVRDLLVDTNALKARYLVVGLKHGFLSRERKVVIPIGQARLDDTNDRVFLDSVSPTSLDTLRDYDATTFQTQERSFFGGDYSHPDYDEDRVWRNRRDASASGDRYVLLHEEQMDVGKRAVSAGDVVVRKDVETEHVRETVPLVHEEVTVERRPVSGDRAVSGDVSVEGEEIRIPVMAEEATVDKRVVAKEEVVIKKTQVTENREVEADLQRERVDVDQAGVKKKEPV